MEFLFKVQAVKEEKMTTAMNPSKQEFIHPEAVRMSWAQPTEPPPTQPVFMNPEKIHSDDSHSVTAPVRRDEPKVGRNDPCPCGSGKKYKKCHGA